jgi:hypothetical protein
MAEADVIGIYREERFSPGKVEDDRAILDLVASELRQGGLAVRMLDGDRLPRLETRPELIFAMCQSAAALGWLDEAATRTKVVNHPHAIRCCYRMNLVERLVRAGVPQPRWAFAAERLPSALGPGPWLKRGDVHAMEASDVRRVFTEDDWARMTAEFERRGIDRAIVQEHVEGAVYKFYGVKGGFFRAYGLPAGQEERAALLAERGASALGLEIYGGDGVYCADGTLTLIDFNDWPSFSRCRTDASRAIGRRLGEIVASGFGRGSVKTLAEAREPKPRTSDGSEG